jgi:hypothetical protein
MASINLLSTLSSSHNYIGAATTAVRDQIMRQNPNSAVFNSAYLNEKVRFDIQSAVMNRPSTDGLTLAFTHMGLTCDPRAPKDVPQSVRNALPPDPKIVKWEEERQTLFAKIRSRYGFLNQATGTNMGDMYKTLVKNIKRTTKKREEDLKKEYRQQYFYRIHNEELQRQLNKVQSNEYEAPVICHQLPERTKLQEVICDLSAELSSEEIVRRRIRTIDLMVALCSQREVPQPKPLAAASRESSGESSSAADSLMGDCALESSPDAEPIPLKLKDKTQCIFCFGNGIKKTFCRPAKMMDHVESHLRLEPAKTVGCRHPVCKAAGLVLDTIEIFKNHVQVVHGITLRDPRFVRLTQ